MNINQNCNFITKKNPFKNKVLIPKYLLTKEINTLFLHFNERMCCINSNKNDKNYISG
jgi:hypothetical protein